MEAFQTLIKIAVAGSAMATEAPETGSAALDAMLAGTTETSPERRLLTTAGCLAVYAAAGTEPLTAEDLPPAAEADEWPALPLRAAAYLARLLEPDLQTLLPATLTLLKDEQVRLPETLLPDFLDLKEELRPHVRPVLGRRGLWLAAQNTDWRWALGEDPETARTAGNEAEVIPRLEHIWQEGDPLQRLAALRHVRAFEPETAAVWLEESWKKDKADQRAAFLEVLKDGLGPADIPFLEGIAKDRSQKIRNTRFLLLAGLPDSSVSRDLKHHADFLRLSRPVPQGGLGGMLKKLVNMPTEKPRMEVLAAEEPDAFWQESGISVKPPQGIGPRAWLLQQMLALIPLDFWQERLEAEPEELIDAARESEWSLSILEGWARSAISRPRTAWLPALVACWRDLAPDAGNAGNAANRVRQLRAELLPGLVAADPAQQAALVELLLNGAPDPTIPWCEIIKSLKQPWPATLARTWLMALRDSLKSHGDEYNHDWLATLPLAAGSLPDECLPEAVQEWDLPKKQENEGWAVAYWRKALDGFSERIGMRLEISEEIHRLRGQNGGIV